MEKSSLFYFHRLKASHKISLNLGVFVYLFDKVCYSISQNIRPFRTSIFKFLLISYEYFRNPHPHALNVFMSLKLQRQLRIAKILNNK